MQYESEMLIIRETVWGVYGNTAIFIYIQSILKNKDYFKIINK